MASKALVTGLIPEVELQDKMQHLLHQLQHNLQLKQGPVQLDSGLQLVDGCQQQQKHKRKGSL